MAKIPINSSHRWKQHCLCMACIVLSVWPTCLPVKQLRLRCSSSFYLKADAVEEGDRVLLLVHITKLLHHISGPSCRRTRKHRKIRKHPHFRKIYRGVQTQFFLQYICIYTIYILGSWMNECQRTNNYPVWQSQLKNTSKINKDDG